MKISKETLDKIHDVSIVTVAEKLGIQLYGIGDEGRRACCPYHEDEHPSLHFSTKRGCFKCFVCGAKGDSIKLVQDKENLSFTEACEWIIKECNVIVTDPDKGQVPRPDRGQVHVRNTQAPMADMYLSPVRAAAPATAANTAALIPLSPDLVDKSLSTQSTFCQSLVNEGYLTDLQMRHAADRYRLGASKEGRVIFWEIDEQQRVHTGKLMHYQPDCHRDKTLNPTWVHAILKDQLPKGFTLQHCLFGLHLLSDNKAVCIVESEKTAVILSELFPDYTWLSCGGLQMFKPELLAPLVNHKIMIFPDTDETGEAFKAWSDITQQATKLYSFQYPLRISSILELHATPEQKARKIDLVDFLFESKE